MFRFSVYTCFLAFNPSCIHIVCTRTRRSIGLRGRVLYLEVGENSNSVEYFLLAYERYYECVRCQVDFFLFVVLHYLCLIIDLRVPCFVDHLSSKGAIGKCNSLFEFVEGVMKEQVDFVQSAAITQGIDADSGPASSLSSRDPQIAEELRKRRAADNSSSSGER